MKYGTRRDKSSQEIPFLPSSSLPQQNCGRVTLAKWLARMLRIAVGFTEEGGEGGRGAGYSGFGHLYPQLQLIAGRVERVCVVRAHASEFNHAQTQLKRAQKLLQNLC